MIQIKRIANEGNMHYFKLDVSPSIHNELIAFLSSLQFPESELIKVDTPFTELDGEYLYVKYNNIKIHFFITKSYINMVIDSDIAQEKLYTLMKKYFLFPS